MLFNSYEFLFAFLLITLAIYFIVARLGREAAILWLVVASLFFYGWWNPPLCRTPVVITVLGWILALTYHCSHRRIALQASEKPSCVAVDCVGAVAFRC